MSHHLTISHATSKSWYGGTGQGVFVATCIATAVFIIYILHRSIRRFDLPVLLPLELLWNAFVYLVPFPLVTFLHKRGYAPMDNVAEDLPQSGSEKHAIKSHALRQLFGLRDGTMSAQPRAGLVRRKSILKSILGATTLSVETPPGLGNWDNSCYQNSILQALSGLTSLTTFLDVSSALPATPELLSTTTSLLATVEKLNDPSNNGSRLWTPAKLKSMSSWQQQDAQEYFSKIMDELDKEVTKVSRSVITDAGLRRLDQLDEAVPRREAMSELSDETGTMRSVRNNIEAQPKQNPLEGFLAQRVACMACGFSEGLSMIPFNCLTLPLGRKSHYDVTDCLDEYTGMEQISGVECLHCTLRRTESQLARMVEKASLNNDLQAESTLLSLPSELRNMTAARLQNVREALEIEDFSDNTINQKCQISKKGRVTSTKTRQAVIARAPRSLVLHINRSLFDEMTGDQLKNYAAVTYPKTLDFRSWCLGWSDRNNGKEQWTMDASASMIAPSDRSEHVPGMVYELRAVVTHYGRHENGHYICYRQHPSVARPLAHNEETKNATPAAKWWRLSDEDVSAVSEEDVLNQGGAFMLFYERKESSLQDVRPRHTPLESQASSAQSDPMTVEVKRKKMDDLDVVHSELVPEVANCSEETAPAMAKQTSQAKIVDTTSDGDTTFRVGQSAVTQPESKTAANAPAMRTSHAGSRRKRRGISSGFRPVAAT